MTERYEAKLKKQAYKWDTKFRLEKELNKPGIFERIDWNSMDSFLRKEKYRGRFTNCTWKLWATRKIEFLHKKARNENCRFCSDEKESCAHVLKCKARDNSVEELLQKLGKLLEKQGGSIIMVQYIIKTIQAWRNDQPQIYISSCITNHEQALNQAIEDQNILGWNLFLRGLHSIKCNTCYES